MASSKKKQPQSKQKVSIQDVDVDAEREKVFDLYFNTVDLCQTAVKQAKAGDAKFNGSLLREIVGFLKQSAGILKEIEQFKRQAAVNAAISATPSEEDANLLAEFEEIERNSEWSDKYDPMSLPLE
ncbi:hypothetical protein [Desulfococcus multivorans]|nr:hypothetical protein [Desulfococcus multivorans]AQV02645.1 hypothetical protein B2D07_18925 [Desulfococcus multivorans]